MTNWGDYNAAIETVPRWPDERASLEVSNAYVDRYIEARKAGLPHADARDDAEREAERVRAMIRERGEVR